jgi:hypothetical protein
MTSIECPKCKRVGKLNGVAELPKAVRCPECRTVFAPSPSDDWEEEPGDDPSATADPPGKPWYRDPILQFAVAVPLIAALAMGAYLYRKQSRERFREEMVALKASADRANAIGEIRDAYDQYARLVEEARGSTVEQVVEVARLAASERDRLLPQVKAHLDREEAERKWKEDEARRLAALKSQHEAEARARYEAEQRRQAEEARLAQFTADLKGGAWVIKGGGQSDILRGLDIYVIRRDVPLSDLHEALGAIQNDPDFSEMGADIRDLPGKPGDTVVSMRSLYKAIRFADLTESDDSKISSLQYDLSWPLIVKQALVAEATTNIDGKYEIKGLKGGHYLLYAREMTRFSGIEWLIPLDIEESGAMSKDFYNGTAVQILNKSD